VSGENRHLQGSGVTNEIQLILRNRANYDRGNAVHDVIASHFRLLVPTERAYELTIKKTKN
jgi:hypothetical protein